MQKQRQSSGKEFASQNKNKFLLNGTHFLTDAHFIWNIHIQFEKEKIQI